VRWDIPLLELPSNRLGPGASRFVSLAAPVRDGALGQSTEAAAIAAAAPITVQPTVPAAGPAACNHDNTGYRPALQVVLASRARAPRLTAEASPGRRVGRLRQAVCTSKGWGLGIRQGISLSSCWLVLLLGSAAGSARVAGVPILAQATPVHRILTHGPPSTLGRRSHRVTAARREVLPRRTAAAHPRLAEDLGPRRQQQRRPHGMHQVGKAPQSQRPFRGLPRHSRQGGPCPAARTRQTRTNSARPDSLLLPRAPPASQPRQGTRPGSRPVSPRMPAATPSSAAWSTPEAVLPPRKGGCPSRRS